jgi:hypothetical protein
MLTSQTTTITIPSIPFTYVRHPPPPKRFFVSSSRRWVTPSNPARDDDDDRYLTVVVVEGSDTPEPGLTLNSGLEKLQPDKICWKLAEC